MGLAPKTNGSVGQDSFQKGPGNAPNSTSDEAKKLAAAALAAVKDDAAVAASGRGKIMVSTLLSDLY